VNELFDSRSDLVVSAVVAYLIPNIILILTTIAMLVIYKVKGNAWYRLTEEEPTGSDVTTHLRSSTIAILIVSCVTLLFCFPYLVIMFIMVTCRSHSCFPGLEVFKATIILCTLTSFNLCLMLNKVFVSLVLSIFN
jgi:positive regulator of sigma E activity